MKFYLGQGCDRKLSLYADTKFSDRLRKRKWCPGNADKLSEADPAVQRDHPEGRAGEAAEGNQQVSRAVQGAQMRHAQGCIEPNLVDWTGGTECHNSWFSSK